MEIQSPLHGAAYRTLFERFQIANVHPEKYPLIEAQLKIIDAWAATQSEDLKAAYVWAAEVFRKQMTATLQQYRLTQAVETVFKIIAKPPEWTPPEGQIAKGDPPAADAPPTDAAAMDTRAKEQTIAAAEAEQVA